MSELVWVSVRHVIHHPSEAEGDAHYYEERITMWRAEGMDAAIALAEAEVAEYCSMGDLSDTGLYQAYLLADEPGPSVSGTETFSFIRGSDLPAEDYLTRFFETGRELTR